MDKIVAWLESCGYTHTEAQAEARNMIERNRWDGVERCSVEFAIEQILNDIEEE
jgi:hypothetical protein